MTSTSWNNLRRKRPELFKRFPIWSRLSARERDNLKPKNKRQVVAVVTALSIVGGLPEIMSGGTRVRWIVNNL